MNELTPEDQQRLAEKHLGTHQLTPCRWWIVPPKAKWTGANEVSLEMVPDRKDRMRYAIRKRCFVLASDGEWEFEPRPSERDDAFFARCRFDTPDDAMKAWDLCIEKRNHPEILNGMVVD